MSMRLAVVALLEPEFLRARSAAMEHTVPAETLGDSLVVLRLGGEADDKGEGWFVACEAGVPAQGGNVGRGAERSDAGEVAGVKRGGDLHALEVGEERHAEGKNADSLCAGKNAPDSRWSPRRFTRPSHSLSLAPEMRNQSNGIDR